MPKNVRYSLSQYKRSNFIANTRENIKTDIISITTDKLENILLKEYDKIIKRPDWKTPLSIFVTLLITLLTSNFKDFFIPKDTLFFFFFLIMIISFVCFIVNLIRVVKKSRKNPIEDLIKKISNIENDEDG